MPTKVVQRTIDFAISEYESTRPKVEAFHQCERLREGQRVLRCLALFMGEAEPIVSPLPASYLLTSDAGVYRYDWVFGIGDLAEESYWWDWQKALRKESAIVVQLLIDAPRFRIFRGLYGPSGAAAFQRKPIVAGCPW